MLFPILNGSGIKWTGKSTATYEGDVAEHDLRNIMSQFWNKALSYTGTAEIDHFWMYCDQKSPAAPANDEESSADESE
jgi:hypothetical protein